MRISTLLPKKASFRQDRAVPSPALDTLHKMGTDFWQDHQIAENAVRKKKDA
jgi:hypothetical protein